MARGRVLLATLLALGLLGGCTWGPTGRWHTTNEALVTTVSTGLATASAATYRGKVHTGDGTLDVDLTLTPDGEGAGTLGTDHGEVEVVFLGGQAYVRAPLPFWEEFAPNVAGTLVTGWSRVAAGALDEVYGVDLAELLRPDALGNALRTTLAEAAVTGPPAAVAGTAAVTLAHAGFRLYASVATPHEVVHLAGRLAPAGPQLDLDVYLLDDALTENLQEYLIAAAETLTNAYDPDATGLLGGGQLAFGPCDRSGCTILVTIENGGDAPLRPLVTLQMSGEGKPDLGSCTVILAPIPPRQSGKGQCRVTDARWRAWVDWAQSTPGSHPYRVRAIAVAALAATPPPAPKAARGFERYAEAAAPDGAGRPRADCTNRLPDRANLDPDQAVRIVTEAARAQAERGRDALVAGFLSPAQRAAYQQAVTEKRWYLAAGLLGLAVHAATAAELRARFGERFLYAGGLRADFHDTKTGGYVELTALREPGPHERRPTHTDAARNYAQAGYAVYCTPW